MRKEKYKKSVSELYSLQRKRVKAIFLLRISKHKLIKSVKTTLQTVRCIKVGKYDMHLFESHGQ